MTNHASYYIDIVANIEDLIDGIKRNCLKNKDIPLEERWKVYCSVERYLPLHDYYGTDVVNEFLKDISFYDDLYTERHTTVYYTYLLERLGDDLGEDEDNEECEYPTKLRFDINTADIKEAILQSGQGGFVYDW